MDRYDRLLRYVFLDNENINIKLVRGGYATVYILPPDVKYKTELEQAEQEAKNETLGIWKK